MSENMLFPTVEVPELIQESEQYDEKYKPSVLWDLEAGDFVRNGANHSAKYAAGRAGSRIEPEYLQQSLRPCADVQYRADGKCSAVCNSDGRREDDSDADLLCV